MLSRRGFVQNVIAAGAISSMGACQTSKAGGAILGSPEAPIGIQLYTLGDLPRTDLDGALGGLSRIGYRKIELPGYLGKSPAVMRAALDRAGLICSSVHVGFSGGSGEFPDLSGDLAQVADQALAVGAQYVVAPMFKAPPDQKLVPLPGEDLPAVIKRIAGSMTADQWKLLADRLNAIGERLKRHGLAFGYHNHNVEFAPHGDTTGWDILLSRTDPDLVVFELDVGWVSAAGLNPVEVLSRHPGRYRLMHVKDLKDSTPQNFLLTMNPAEVGAGRIDWPAVLDAARTAGVREYFVEQEPPFEHDRMESARISFDFLAARTRA